MCERFVAKIPSAGPRAGRLLAWPFKNPWNSRFGLRDWTILEQPVKQQHQVDTREAKQSQAILIWKLIGEIDRTVRLLDCDIKTEEERVGISNRSDATYPILARTLATRRDNLKDTMSALEQRLPKLDQPDLVAELA
jgi:hypothetical protein